MAVIAIRSPSMSGWSGSTELVCHSWTAVRSVALVILSHFDVGADGVAVNVVLVVVIMSEIAGGCSLMGNSSWCNVAGKLWSCWQKSAAAASNRHCSDFWTDTHIQTR